MAIFYLTLLYFFIFLGLVRFKYIEIGRSFPDIPIYFILLGLMAYFILSLINIIIYRNKHRYSLKIKLGYIKKYQGNLVINLGAGVVPLLLLLYLYPRTALIPLLIVMFVSVSIGLMIYQHKKNIENKLPVLNSVIISVIGALFLTPANPVFVILTVFICSSFLILLSNLILRHKKNPLYLGEQSFYHIFFILLLIVLTF